MVERWLVLGLSGVTCSGKTTLAHFIHATFNDSVLFSQDDYFLDDDDPRHVRLETLVHVNYEILTSLDMNRMYGDIVKIIDNTQPRNVGTRNENEESSSNELVKVIRDRLKETQRRLLIIEGFSFLAHASIQKLCDIKFYLMLSEKECFKRRQTRTYNPPDCEGYFEKCVWPEYLKHYEFISKDVDDVQFVHGEVEDIKMIVLKSIVNFLSK